MTRAVWMTAISAVVVVLAAGIAYLGFFVPGGRDDTAVRMTLPPYIDTHFIYVGDREGASAEQDLDLRFVEAGWDRQYDLLAAGEADVIWSTLDEFVAKTAGLAQIDRPVRYILPAWQFVGLGFFGGKGIKPYDAFKKTSSDSKVAKTAFLDQLRNKKVVFPEAGVFDQAFSRFLEGSGLKRSDFQIVNAPPDSALNSLEDPEVGLVAVFSQQRFEAMQRGYRPAIAPKDVGLVVITGFAASAAILKQDPTLPARLACTWYASVNLVNADEAKAFEITQEALARRGAEPITEKQYRELRQLNVLPSNPKQAEALFLQSGGGAYWRDTWEATVEELKSGGRTDAVPANTDSFLADATIRSAGQECASGS